MAKIIKRQELDKKFTEAVMKYMTDGMFISTRSMCGHQGEDGKVDLTDGKSTYRVLAYTTHEKFQGVYVIEVRKYDEYVTRSMQTLWNNEGELVETFYKAYEIETHGESVYVESKEEAKAVQKLQGERWRRYDENYWRTLNGFDAETVASAVRATDRRGYKRTKAGDIVKVERRCDTAQYRVEIAGKGIIVIG